MGEEARYRAFMANLMRVVTSGRQINEKFAPKYSDVIDESYKNPFACYNKADENEGQEIIKMLLSGGKRD